MKTVDGNGNSVVKCVWPPSPLNVTSDFLKECVEPSDNWNTYRIKLYENGKEFSMYLYYIIILKSKLTLIYYFDYTILIFLDDFGKAWYKHVALSDQSTSEVDHQNLNKTKNKRMYSQSFMMPDETNTSSDEGN